MSKVYLNVSLDPEYLAEAITELDHEEVMEVIKYIDEIVADYSFTKALRDHFAKVIAECDAAEESAHA